RHEVMLHSLLSEALGRGELPERVVPFACESGRVDFECGNAYRIGFTIAGTGPDDVAERIGRALAAYGARGFQGERIPMLRWFTAAAHERLPSIDVDAECAALAKRNEIELRFVSPLRLEIPRTERGDGSSFFDAAQFPAGDFLRLLWNRIFFLAEERYPHRDEIERLMPPVPPIACDPRQLLWVDVPRTTKPAIGGVLGRLLLQNPGEAWLPFLAAAQFLHLGKSCGYGFGAYRIADGSALHDDPFGPSRTILERVAERERLTAAAAHVAACTEGGGADGIGPEEFLRRQPELVSTVIRGLADGSYRAAPLLGVLLPKGAQKIRALAVPTLTDRAVQRAALEVIGPAVDTLLEDCSYAYRKGFSRAGAARAVERAYANGYRWVLDADIDSFFDSVDWARLFAKIEALYPFEPTVNLLRDWIAAPVVFQGRLIQRTRGLPQGAVISPLLANLFLDELDEELLRDDFRLVRYADDFVVLCKDLSAAERARDEARAALERLGLSLQEEKTSIRSADHGFSYLGYLFCRSVAVQQQRADAPDAVDGEISVSPSSWLAQADLSRVRDLAAATSHRALPRVVPLLHTGAPAGTDARRPLYVADPAVSLHLHEGAVVVEKEGAETKRYPLRALSHVVFIGTRRATLPLVLELGLTGVPAFFCRRNGELEAVHGPFDPDVDAWLAQSRCGADEATRLSFAQEIVAAKLHNYAAVAVRHRLRGCEAAAAEIRELERAVWNKTEIDSVRGVEGAAAVVYFRSVAETLSAEWQFDGRARHPPQDPFNALLSYGYTLLYHHCTTALYAARLAPRIGVYHRQHGTWDALSSDLQEEFRYLADGLAWSLVRRREIRPDDFDRTERGCWLLPEPRRRFIDAFEQRMETAFKPNDEERAMTYREAIGVQAVRLREYLLGRGRYVAVRAHG
ncbi:MAG TPA: CRISPR-associated endonuclease Cas1, partial [Thermoanaerobaculia bacterium]